MDAFDEFDEFDGERWADGGPPFDPVVATWNKQEIHHSDTGNIDGSAPEEDLF